MPYRMRPTRWDLLVNPTLAGLREEAEASARFGQTLIGSGAAIGEGIARGKTRREQQRRFNEEMGLRKADDARADRAQDREDAEFLLRYEEAEERRRDRQASDTDMLNDLGVVTESMAAEAAAGGQPSPQTAQDFKRTVDGLGGAQAAYDRIARRASGRVIPDRPRPTFRDIDPTCAGEG